MKKSVLLSVTIVLGLILGFGWKTNAQATSLGQKDQSSAIIPQPLVQEMIDQVNQARFLTDLRRFTGVDELCVGLNCGMITNRLTGGDDLTRVESYVYWNLVNMHYSVEALGWTNGVYTDTNILAHKQGLLYPNEEIYFIAHMDGVPSDGPAADDDGTGTAALLELARILSTRYLSRSVTLFFSTGEEQGSKGSKEFVEHFSARLGDIKYLVSVEMLGYDDDNDGVMELWSGDTNTEFQVLLSQIITAYPINLTPEVITGCT